MDPEQDYQNYRTAYQKISDRRNGFWSPYGTFGLICMAIFVFGELACAILFILCMKK